MLHYNPQRIGQVGTCQVRWHEAGKDPIRARLILLCLLWQTGVIVTGASSRNWTTQASDFTYVTLHPNLADLVQYRLVLGALVKLAEGLLSGSQAQQGYQSCATSNPQLARLVLA